MVKQEKILSRTGWWRIEARLSLVILLSAMLMLGPMAAMPSLVQAAELRVCAGGCPYKSIQAAIDAASSGDTIKVAQGTYDENLFVTKTIILLGGYLTSNWNTQGPASSTIINGSGGSNSVIRVYTADATVDNFTITGGSGKPSPSGTTTAGGGICIEKSTPTISNNIIQGNSANYGGGIYLGGTGQPQILNNTISDNTAVGATSTGWGGGLCILEMSPIIKGNTINNNHAYWGGGILVGESRATIEGNIITDNQVQGGDAAGGAIFSELAAPIIKNNLIAGNTSSLYADGIYMKYLSKTHYPGVQAQVINNTIVANKYSDSGIHEGIHVRGGISPLIYNNIVALNGYGIRNYPYELASPVLSNNDVWGNSVADYSNLSPGTDDISANPLFVNQSSGDYHLQRGAPCIDAGTSSDAPTTDFEGDPRPLDGDGNGSAQWDIGADEYTLWITKRASPSSTEPGDLITYVITYRNSGASTATGVVITDILSTEDLLDPSFTSRGANNTPRAGTPYVWDVQNLSPGFGGIITITAQIGTDVATPAVIPNTAEFYAEETGSFSDDAPIIVGGLKAYLPVILKGY